jgi:hypothetical protein
MKKGIQNELATAEDEFAWAEERKEVSLQLSEEVAGVYGFVHHTFENKYYQQKGQVWGPTTVDHIRMVLRARYRLEDDKADQAIIEITEDGQVFQAANVVGYKSGVYRDRSGNPYLILQSHNLITPVEGDWPLIREITESMFGPIQTLYLYGWLQWA